MSNFLVIFPFLILALSFETASESNPYMKSSLYNESNPYTRNRWINESNPYNKSDPRVIQDGLKLHK